ncbi:MAG: isocitrate/isopropylmalate family dehydrogenase [Eubacteriales bacterium]|nr:isocitrate/isopropylmalate family dehydrogenase [Eubacteriales bacterium]MDY3332767.1 isocitrate/isopropylmalate family dehydrogenase [Gallibacter sp.]
MNDNLKTIMLDNKLLDDNLNKVKELILSQLQRIENIKNSTTSTDFAKKDKIVIGTIAGDGIGPIIMESTLTVLQSLLADKIECGAIELKKIDGLTIENRIKLMQSVPDNVLNEIKSCDVILKGPTTTPGKNDNMPNIESANVTLRRELDLFANVRPITIPEKNINWIFFRENTEGEYTLGSKGIDIQEDISLDFKIISDVCTQRIAKSAYEYAKNNGNLNVSIITKANILKKTDGRFLNTCLRVSKDYPEIKTDDWYVDICAANLINNDINSKFNVFILPNLYGDIITDEAAQLQGGVGTAGSANIGSQYAMFEAIHGSAPRMLEEGIEAYANPASLMRAAEMLLRHISYIDYADKLNFALNKTNEKLNMTGNIDGNTADDFVNQVIKYLEV